jgi:hypothetical protein
MILDKENMFSEAQAVTVTALSTKKVLSKAAGDAVKAPWLVISAAEAAAAAGAATVEFQLITSDNDDMSSPKVLFSSGPIAKADITLGARLVKVRVPAGCKKNLAVNYVVSTGPLTTGKFNAFLTYDV